MVIDFTPYRRAADSLRVALDRASKVPDDDMMRDACIQRFEYTYELAIRMLRRQLSEMLSPDEVLRLSYRDFIRVGAERGFIQDPKAWFVFRERRNITSHTYNEEKAALVFSSLPSFLAHAQLLLERLDAGT